MTFTWIPFYKEFAQKLLKFRNDRKSLVNWIYDNLDSYTQHLRVGLDEERLPDIDPFSIMGVINRQITYKKKMEICAICKSFLNISADAPQDFYGVPEMNNLNSAFIGYGNDRGVNDIEKLWRVFEDAVLDKDIKDDYDALKGQFLIKYNITFGLFWIRPDKYLALDGHNRANLEKLGVAHFGTSTFVPYQDYKGIMDRLDAKIKSGELACKNYAEFSYSAYTENDGASTKDVPKSESIRYWTYSPGANASKWELCLNEKIMCIGWDELGDLLVYSSREEMQKQIKLYYPSKGSAKNDSLAVWQFSNEMKPGDIVFAKKGRNTIIGRGVVESDYKFDPNCSDFKHIRRVNWTHIGEWFINDTTAMKTLTNITRYTDYVAKLNNLVGCTSEGVSEAEESYNSSNVNYWWLVANPSIWSVSDWEIGEEQSYTFYNDQGNRRRIFKHFLSAKEGDIVIGYDSSPRKQVLGLFVISKVDEGEELYFKKTKDLSPIDFATLMSTPELLDMEYMKNQQGSFFKLTPEEFKVIMSLANGGNLEDKVKYSKSDFIKQVYVDVKDYDSLENLLLRKKNLILQGAPGVGKTFAAKRLAYALMGEKDENRIMQVQFHQNYSYEDFVMGYKPNENGGFDLKNGIFYEFCKRAEKDSERKYFFIIDEINRGNLSKIFGELLMLIENDYRDKEIQLAYRDEKFAVPSNLYIIGMMNTADRSLAMIDYALRRRFSFFDMKPSFDNPVFQKELREKNDIHLDNLVKAIIELNNVIENDDSLGSGFCIGHSYLCNLGYQYDLANIVEYDIIPMLREYWFDNEERFNQEAQKLRNALK